ncbi:carbohydrate ABC transporter permease [Microbacterium esteraromaticum]|uniref:carbohydrate ABC transporter permease n=1 Tax=Microbacterium esteraromaticum TaxID=57043 RepID=UPI00195A17DC|nr:sugar ABC transporter permease [Microbacterium esteraromaticum]MBM7466621.1 raffinose/stachyose/melibiose transport system permease protein [Microbacterium esteraromaticum]
MTVTRTPRPTDTVSVVTPWSRRRPRTSSIFPRRLNWFYVPALVLFAVFSIYPLISGVSLSLTNWNGYSRGKAFVGVDNYLRLLDDDVFRTALVNTLIYGVGSTIIQQVLGLGLAVVLDRVVRGASLLRAVIYLPVMVSPVVLGTMYYLIFRYNNGALNDLRALFGAQQVAWLSDATVGITVIVVVNSLQFVGISMVIYLAGLQGVPTEYYEAAQLDGATWWQSFRSIALPLLQPAFATSIVLNLIGGLKLFDVVQVLTGGGPGHSTHSVSTLIGETYFSNQAAGYSAAIGVVLFVLIVAVTFVLNALLNRKRVEL